MMKSKKMLSLLGAGLCSAALLSGCCMLLEDEKEPEFESIMASHQELVNRAQELDQLADKAWVPVFIQGQGDPQSDRNAITIPENQQAYIVFSRDGKVSGFAGVNRFFGAYSVIAPDLIRFGALGTTMMAGPHLDYEMLFLAQINEVNHFKLVDGMLELYQRNILLFRCKAVDPASVENNVDNAEITNSSAIETER